VKFPSSSKTLTLLREHTPSTVSGSGGVSPGYIRGI